MLILPAAKAWGNSLCRNASSSATLIFAIVMSLRLSSPVAASYIRMPALQGDIYMNAQTARASAPPGPILLREMGGSVAVLTLNRPAARNSLSEAMIAELHAAL